jgi:RES domain-containing protein
LILYRVSNHTDLAGKGGELADGRWHTRQQGRRIVYLSDHPALCLLETLVHVKRADELPDTYQLLSVEIPDDLIESIKQAQLRDDWQTNIVATQQIGNIWLLEAKSAGLLVPSVIVPIARNCLLNPLVPAAAKAKLKVVGRFPFDARLLRQPKQPS